MASGPRDPAVVCAEVMATVASGVAVLTLVDGDGVMRGTTISSLTPVSADPPSVLVCLGSAASCRPAMGEGRAFCVNVLTEEQVAVSNGFAFGEDDPFTEFAWEQVDDGPPILDGVAAHLTCVVEQVVEHHGTAVVMARVVDGSLNAPGALVFWQEGYHGSLRPI